MEEKTGQGSMWVDFRKTRRQARARAKSPVWEWLSLCEGSLRHPSPGPSPACSLMVPGQASCPVAAPSRPKSLELQCVCVGGGHQSNAYLGRSPLPQAPTPGLPVYKECPLQTPSRSLGDNGLGVFSGSFWREKLSNQEENEQETSAHPCMCPRHVHICHVCVYMFGCAMCVLCLVWHFSGHHPV